MLSFTNLCLSIHTPASVAECPKRAHGGVPTVANAVHSHPARKKKDIETNRKTKTKTLMSQHEIGRIASKTPSKKKNGKKH